MHENGGEGQGVNIAVVVREVALVVFGPVRVKSVDALNRFFGSRVVWAIIPPSRMLVYCVLDPIPRLLQDLAAILTPYGAGTPLGDNEIWEHQ